MRPGDVLLCYVARTSAFVGALEVTSNVYEIDHEDEAKAAIVTGLAPYRTADGGYVLENEFRYVLARA